MFRRTTMSKKKKKQRDEEQFDGLARVLREAMQPMTVERLATQARENPDVAQSWVAQTERPCCELPKRDGVVVVIGTEEFLRRAALNTGYPLDIIQVYAISEHMNEVIPIALDVEAAKRLVNNLGSAISALEARRR
jgi:hypothetical protein